MAGTRFVYNPLMGSEFESSLHSPFEEKNQQRSWSSILSISVSNNVIKISGVNATIYIVYKRHIQIANQKSSVAIENEEDRAIVGLVNRAGHVTASRAINDITFISHMIADQRFTWS